MLLEAKKVVFIVPEKQYKKHLEGAIPVLVNTVSFQLHSCDTFQIVKIYFECTKNALLLHSFESCIWCRLARSFPFFLLSIKFMFLFFQRCSYVSFFFQGNWMETAEEIDDLFLGDAEVCFSGTHTWNYFWFRTVGKKIWYFSSSSALFTIFRFGGDHRLDMLVRLVVTSHWLLEKGTTFLMSYLLHLYRT